MTNLSRWDGWRARRGCCQARCGRLSGTFGEGPVTVRSKPASQNDVTLLIIKPLIVTGLRISKLTNLKVRDVSPDGGQILLNGKGGKPTPT